MILDRRLCICAITSIVGHVAFVNALEVLPRREDRTLSRVIQVRVVAPPPPPPRAPPEPEPDAPLEPQLQPEPVRHERVRPPKPDVRPAEGAVSDRSVLEPDPNATPVFGVTMESTSQASAGPAMPVGNTGRPVAHALAPVRPLAEAVAAIEVTKMPLPQGRCFGKYTAAARAAGIEGVVVLDLVVDVQGRARDISVVEGLSHGLTEAAIAALDACRFTPGEKDGKAVAVRVRGFKIRFLMPSAP